MKQVLSIKLKSYDVPELDLAAKKIVGIAKKTGALISGPIPLPVKREVYTILRSVHVNKKSREQFEMRTHKRLIKIESPSASTMDSLQRIELPSNVDIEIKL